MKKLVLTLSAALALIFVSPPARADSKITLRAQTADSRLRPGDLLFNYARGASESWYGKVIRKAQAATKAVSSKLHAWMKRAEPSFVHVAIYLGGGRLAEAFGSNPENAGVKEWSLDTHPGERYLVVRAKDEKLAQRAAEIASRWVTGKKTMAFLYPFHVPMADSSFGRRARDRALRYGKDAEREGGPKGVKAMFCSELVLAVYQSAIVSAELARHPKLRASAVKMPTALQVDALNTGPAAAIASLRRAERDHEKLFEEKEEIEVDPTLPAQPSPWQWLKKKLAHLKPN